MSCIKCSSKSDISKNKVRTSLLLLVNDEYRNIRKCSRTKINSKSIREYENQFSHTVICLKEEKYTSNSNVKGEAFQIKSAEKFVLKSPDLDLKEPFIKRNPIRSDTFKLANSKRIVSHKKNEYFRRNTLKCLKSPVNKTDNDVNKMEKIVNIEQNLEYINIDAGIMNQKTLERTEKGFNYLQKLTRRLKKVGNKNKEGDFNFEEMRKILCWKENIDEETKSNSNGTPPCISTSRNNDSQSCDITQNIFGRQKSNTVSNQSFVLSNSKSDKQIKYEGSDKQVKNECVNKNSFLTINYQPKPVISKITTLPLPNKDNLNTMKKLELSFNFNQTKYPNSSRKMEIQPEFSPIGQEKMNNSFRYRNSKDFFIKLYNCSDEEKQGSSDGDDNNSNYPYNINDSSSSLDNY